MRSAVWKKTAMIAMKQHGFQKNIINHQFYCEWPHCLAVAIFEVDEEQHGMRVRLDIFTYRPDCIMDFTNQPDATGYLTRDQESLFGIDVSKEEAYDQIINALKETIPILIGNLK